MNFSNFCSQIDMDAIKAKIPPLPDMVTQLKLPKSISKLKSRKIFGTSRDNIHADEQHSGSKRPPADIPSSGFVDHTPHKISTISSLVDQRKGGSDLRGGSIDSGEGGFYRSAGGIDDYCPSPSHENFGKGRDSIPHISPRDGQQTTEEGGKLSFVERVQKGYKDVSEFKFKHLFVKKTVVRQDGIKLDDYIERYSEDRRRDERFEQKMEQIIADNYNFNFTTSRRKSEESFGISTPSDSPPNMHGRKNKIPLSEQSGDESGMEQSPPPRKAGIAASRFSRVKKLPLNMSLEEDEGIDQVALDDSDGEREVPLRKPIQTKAETVRRQKSEEEADESDEIEVINVTEDSKPSMSKPKSIKKRVAQTIAEETKVASPKKRKAPLTPQQSAENNELNMSPSARRTSLPSEAPPAKSMVTIKENFKRFQKSIKLGSSTGVQSGEESEAYESNAEGGKTKQSKSQQFAERLKRFRSVDNVDNQIDEGPDKTYDSPMHRLNNRLQGWKKSLKKKPDTQRTADVDEDGAASPQKIGKHQQSIMKKLKHIRSRKRQSADDPDDDEEGGATYREDFRARAKLQLEKGMAAASQMPQMTMEKLRETKKYFRKAQEKEKETDPQQEPKKESKQNVNKNDSEESNLDDDEDEKGGEQGPPASFPKVKNVDMTTAKQHYYSSDEEGEDDEDEYDRRQQVLANEKFLEPHQQKVLVPVARAAWTSKPIHSDSMDTGDDDDDALPRVLIHQDNSDVFESTLIIAVTRPMPRSHSPSSFITELQPDSPKASTPETKADNWIPNQEIISGFLATSAHLQRELSRDSIASTSPKGHSRKQSMDSSSEDSWMKDVPKLPSTAIGLNSVTETDESWKIFTEKDDEKLYKTKSIDIFERSGGLKIFEDFDDELRNAPIVKIVRQAETKVMEIREITSNDSFEQDSSEEFNNADDDDSSRVTKILKQSAEVEELELHQPQSPPIKPRNDKLKTHFYGNSTESLMGNLEALNNSQDEDDDTNSDEANDSCNVGEYNRPPSTAPSPPPPTTPPPPPLPIRQPSIRLSKITKLPSIPPEESPSPFQTVPPLPQTKPPLPPNRPAPPPPKIPDGAPSMSKVAKPLVKTSSLRLSFDEQVNPQDVGKVNKLISRFEPNGGYSERPRLIPRRPYISQSPEDHSEDDEGDSSEAESEEQEKRDVFTDNKTILASERSWDTTPTNKPKLQKSFSINSDELPLTPINNMEEIPIQVTKSTKYSKPLAPTILASPPPQVEELINPKIPSIKISSTSPQSDRNSNFSQPNSEYGSPMAYPSSLVGSAQATPQSSRKDVDSLNNRRSRRSMTRDDERFFSFDSDEENSYYSIGSTKSNRYVVDL